MAAAVVRIGTSSWSSPDWRGRFYPPATEPGDFLSFYATRFDTVECDATFYRIPSARTVDGWREKTPEGFLFAAKLPQEITHERGLVACEPLVREFVEAMGRLGARLGPIVAQFPYVAKGKDPREHATGDAFRERLARFLEGWPREREIAVEVRNASWIGPPLLDLLRERKVALVLSSYFTMPGPERLFAGPDPLVTDLAYVRFLGDHKRMDERVARLRAEGRREADWSEPALDRDPDMRRWVPHLKRRAAAGARVLAYFNNHYAGYAPASAERFRGLWDE